MKKELVFVDEDTLTAEEWEAGNHGQANEQG